MRIAVAREVRAGERRVALVPSLLASLLQEGHDVWVEAGAGAGASLSDEAFVAAGARISTDAAVLWEQADILLKVGPLTARQQQHEVELLRQGSCVIGLLNPLREVAVVRRLAERLVTAFSMDLIPRLSRAQSMDALSSQATVAGYKAVLLAADRFGKFFPMLTTAAGSIAPARVLVIGAGVAGLMAIATARRLGAVVEAFDIRPGVREEVQSLGATFVAVELTEETIATGGYAREVSAAARFHEQEVLKHHVARADVVITAAQAPGVRAPLLVTEDMVTAMQPGGVIVDLAADQGGNCACTIPGQEVVHHGVSILGPQNIPSLMPLPASQMYARNIMAFLHHIVKDKAVCLDSGDDITQGACVTHAGDIVQDRVRQAVQQAREEEGRIEAALPSRSPR